MRSRSFVIRWHLKALARTAPLKRITTSEYQLRLLRRSHGVAARHGERGSACNGQLSRSVGLGKLWLAACDADRPAA
jgi:hypothetical protein